METYLIVGLGNYGKKYENTRHNCGFRTLDHLAGNLNININREEKKFKALIAATNRKGLSLLLIKPLTYMNLSGEAVKAVSAYFDIPVDHIIIVSDDVYLERGRLRVRSKGSAGGHNGLKNIIENLGSEDFLRVRIGIGPKKDERQDLVDFVLGHFDKDELELMEKIYEEAAKAILSIIDEGLPKAMDRYNGLNLSNPHPKVIQST